MFNRIFNADNPFWRVMGRIFDAVELNLLWVLGCLPIVTFGASTTAFYYAMINLQRGEEGILHRDFWKSFKLNLKQGSLMGLLLMPMGAFLAFDVYIARKQGPGIYAFFMVFFAVVFLLWAFVTLYAFPLLAKFDNSTKKTLVLAFTLSMRNLPKTLVMLAATWLALMLCRNMPLFALFVFGLVVDLQTAFLADIFKPWLPKTGVGGSEEEL